MKRTSIHPLVSLLAFSAFGCAAGKSEPAAPEFAPKATEPVVDSEPSPAEPAFTPQFAELRVKASTGSFLQPLPTAVTSFGAAEADGVVYVMGGYHGTPHRYSKEGQSDEIWKLPLDGSASWTRAGKMESALQGLASVGYGDSICQFGGTHAHNAMGEPADLRSVDTARCFDTKKNEWSDLPALPAPRSSHEVARIGAKVFVAGGWNLKGEPKNSEWAEDMLVLDLSVASPSWDSVEVPFKVRAVGVAAAGTHLMVAGGLSPKGAPTSEVHLYDLETKEWSQGPDFPADAFGLGVTSAGGKFYASARDGMLRSLAPGDKKWTDVRPLSFGRFFHQLVATEEEVVVLGGIGGMHTRGRTKPVEKLPLDSKVSAFGTVKVSHPGLSKNRQGFVWNGEQAYFFGGNNSLGQHDFARKNFLNEGWILDLATLKASPAPSFPENRQSMVTLTSKSGGLAVGGFGFATQDEAKDAQAKTADDIYEFEWEGYSWEKSSSLVRGRTQFGLYEHEGTRWILGGLNYDPTREGPAAFDHVLDIQKAKKGQAFEESKAKLPGPRRAFAGTVHQGKIYLVGGMKEGFSLVDDCQAFDLKTETFSEISCPTGARLSGELIAVDDRLYLLGGSVRGDKGMEENRSVEVYDPSSDKWTKLDFEIPMSVRHMRAFPFNNQILLFSTHHEGAEMVIATLSPPRD